jgi:hypothetical protein
MIRRSTTASAEKRGTRNPKPPRAVPKLEDAEPETETAPERHAAERVVLDAAIVKLSVRADNLRVDAATTAARLSLRPSAMLGLHRKALLEELDGVAGALAQLQERRALLDRPLQIVPNHSP